MHSDYTFCISTCVPWELNPQPFALLTQCSTTEPQEKLDNKIPVMIAKSQERLEFLDAGWGLPAPYVIDEGWIGLNSFPAHNVKSNHFYCHITTAHVPWWVKFLRACSRFIEQFIVHKQHSHIGVFIFQVGESSVQGEVNSIVCGTVAAICKL